MSIAVDNSDADAEPSRINMSTASLPRCTARHVVSRQDTWASLTQRFKISRSELLTINQMRIGARLVVGRRLCVATRSSESRPVPVTTVPSTTVTPSTVAGPIAPVLTVGELVACGRVSVAWRGANPDTGVYSVQWVRVNAPNAPDFNTYSMVLARGNSITLPNWFVSGATYAIRVYAMRDDWDGYAHTNQNVTAHSAIVTFEVPPCVPPSCAQGGQCIVGDTGPGGGRVFYVAVGTFSSPFSDCDPNCRYMEVAPVNHVETSQWCSDTTTLLNVTAQGIGQGMSNTRTAANTCTSGAIRLAADYTNNGKTDWHLPSKEEFNELCKFARRQTTGDRTIACDNTGSLQSDFSADRDHWTSSEISATFSHAQELSVGAGAFDPKTGDQRVRIVRAFG